MSISSRGSTVLAELKGGTVTFLTMSYVFFLIPHFVSTNAMDSLLAYYSISLSAGLGSILVGILGNLPVCVAPSVGLIIFESYNLERNLGLHHQESSTAGFLSALILIFLWVTGLSKNIMHFIPKPVKVGAIIGMGLQIAMAGLTIVPIIVSEESTLVKLGPLDSPQLWLSLLGVVLAATLLYHQVPGSFLLGCFITSFIWFSTHDFPSIIAAPPNLTLVLANIKQSAYIVDLTDFETLQSFNWGKITSALFGFLFIGLIDVSGVLFGMASISLIEEDGTIPGSTASFVATSLGTMLSAVTGGAPLIVYAESASGIKSGGRTGLSSVVTGLLFLLVIFLQPIFCSVPACAAAPAAILVGGMMMGQAVEVDWNNMKEAVPAFLTLFLMPLTYSVTDGVILGLTASLLLYITTGQVVEDISLAMWGRRSVGPARESTDTVNSVEMEELEFLTNGIHPNKSYQSTTQPNGGHDSKENEP